MPRKGSTLYQEQIEPVPVSQARHLPYTVYLLTFSAICFCADAANDSLTSSLDQGNGDPRSACPGEEVNYTCTLVDMVGIGTTVWEGSAFNCPLADNINEIRLLHPNFNDPGGESGQCGALTVQSQPVVGNCYTSVLTVLESAVTEELNGATIQCGIAGLSPVGEKTLTVIPLPAPVITVTELTLENVRVNVTGYPEESEQCITNFTAKVTSGTGEMAFSESGLSVDIELDLCADVYTFRGRVMSNSVSSNMSEEVELNSTLSILAPVTNVRSDNNFVTLDWDAPVNSPDNCIVNYQIAVSGFSTFNTTTDDNSTSISVSSLSLTACEEYFVTVAPITIGIGVVETSRSDPPYGLMLAEGFPSPRISSIGFIYTPQGIVVNLTWENSDLLFQFANVLVLFDCGSEDICTLVNLSAPSSSHSLTLSYSVLGLDIEFSVTFISTFCQRRTSITTSFSNILKSVDISNVTHNTAEVVVVYNSSINTLEGYTVRATIYPLNSSGPVQLFSQEVSFPPASALEDQLTFSFTGLKAATDYVFNVRILSTWTVIGRAESGSFTTESEPIPGATALSTGAAVAISTTVTFIVAVTIGCLSGALLYHILTKIRTRSSKYHPESSGGGQQPTVPLYEDVSPPPAGGKIELRENVAYGPVQR